MSSARRARRSGRPSPILRRLAEWPGEALTVELRPGGELVLRLPDGEERRGFVEESDPPAALVLWWRPVDENGEEGELTRVAFLLEADEEGTRLRVVESRPLSRLDVRGIELPASRRALGGQARGPLALVG